MFEYIKDGVDGNYERRVSEAWVLGGCRFKWNSDRVKKAMQ